MKRIEARLQEVVHSVIGNGFNWHPSIRLCADLGFDSLDLQELDIELGVEFGGTFRLNVSRKTDMTLGELVALVENGPD